LALRAKITAAVLASAAGWVDEVMNTGHVGAEHVEYVLRHKRGLSRWPLATP